MCSHSVQGGVQHLALDSWSALVLINLAMQCQQARIFWRCLHVVSYNKLPSIVSVCQGQPPGVAERT